MLYFLVKPFADGIEETYDKRTLHLCIDSHLFCSEYKFLKVSFQDKTCESFISMYDTYF